jgi:hypothetical protein
VFGWFSSRADDPLAKVDGKCDFTCLRKELGWDVAPNTDRSWTASMVADVRNGDGRVMADGVYLAASRRSSPAQRLSPSRSATWPSKP